MDKFNKSGKFKKLALQNVVAAPSSNQMRAEQIIEQDESSSVFPAQISSCKSQTGLD